MRDRERERERARGVGTYVLGKNVGRNSWRDRNAGRQRDR